ncbi:MAG: hypothetical protein IPL18_11965 [Sphingomonadales bacterium]|nr:hypothetical protein [Sphingomonadales bacterium]
MDALRTVLAGLVDHPPERVAVETGMFDDFTPDQVVAHYHAAYLQAIQLRKGSL